ncbi:type I phosphomannose isomerase catalytic subunit [Treponema sp.]|uniref:type I phosphomannose isomerase catalytic subunit n=1 Tax=Treponema sp. TaxID=166 RepID=UPI003F04FB64
MIKLKPIQCDKIWGYERWIASTHSDGCQKEFLEALGKNYPLIVKVIQANETLSVQVHPDDETARQLEGGDACGKTECWYVLDAEPDSRLAYGVKKDISKAHIENSINEGTFQNDLSFINVRKGDFIFIPSGTVHAIGKGIRVLEVQQSCNITYRMYDWGRPRELHVQKSLASLKNCALSEPGAFPGKFECEYFSLEFFDGNSFRASETTLLFLLEGNGVQISSSGSSLAVEPEDIVAVFPGEEISVSGKGRFMKILSR